MRPWLIIVTSGPPKVLVVSYRTTKVLKGLENLDLQAVFAYKARATLPKFVSRFNPMVQLPLARQTGLIIKELPGEVLVYDSDRDSALCLNRTAASVWKHCDGKTPPARMARLIEKELQITGGDEVVSLALERLEKSHLLTGKPPVRFSGVSRRELIGRIGIAAAVPVISLILVPTAKAGGSCLPHDSGCELNSDCCSNCCSDGSCVPTNNCIG